MTTNCKLSKLKGELVKFYATNNRILAKDSDTEPGNVYIYSHSGLSDETTDRHDIFISGEHIAGGYGFDNPDLVKYFSEILESEDATPEDLALILKSLIANHTKIEEVISRILVDEGQETTTTAEPIEIIDDAPVSLNKVSVTLKIKKPGSSEVEDIELGNSDLYIEVGSRIYLYYVKFDIFGAQAREDDNNGLLNVIIQNINGNTLVDNYTLQKYREITWGANIGEILLNNDFYKSVFMESTVPTTNQFVVRVTDSNNSFATTPKQKIHWVYPYFTGNYPLKADVFEDYKGTKVLPESTNLLGTKFTIEHGDIATYGYMFIPKKMLTENDMTVDDLNIVYSKSNISGYWEVIDSLEFQYKGYSVTELVEYICLRSLNKYTGSTTWEIKKYI